MSRVVGGTAGGRRLAVPPGRGTRPTSEKAREALFNTLAAEVDLTGAAVLDLYAGSGAVGIEALSRGAGRAVLVESDPRVAAVARANLAVVTGGQVRTLRVERFVSTPPEDGRFDVVFADPPYALADADLAVVLADLAEHGWLAPRAVLVVERAARSPEPTWPPGTESHKSRRYGDTVLWYGRRP